jgi:hypothetical protein
LETDKITQITGHDQISEKEDSYVVAEIIQPGDISAKWETEYRPRVLQHKRVPLDLVAEIMGYRSIEPIKAMLRSKMFSFGSARKENLDGEYKYEVFPLRFVAWYEGRLQ